MNTFANEIVNYLIHRNSLLTPTKKYTETLDLISLKYSTQNKIPFKNKKSKTVGKRQKSLKSRSRRRTK